MFGKKYCYEVIKYGRLIFFVDHPVVYYVNFRCFVQRKRRTGTSVTSSEEDKQ